MTAQKLFSINLTQTGTNAPVINSAINTLNTPVTLTYVGTGVYHIIVPTLFKSAKTYIVNPTKVQAIDLETQVILSYYVVSRIDDDTLEVRSYNLEAPILANTILSDSKIEVMVTVDIPS